MHLNVNIHIHNNAFKNKYECFDPKVLVELNYNQSQYYEKLFFHEGGLCIIRNLLELGKRISKLRRIISGS